MPRATDRPVVGMIGLGLMGSAMSGSLLNAGYEVVGYDVASPCRTAHRRAGGRVAASALEVASRADVVVTSLPSVAALAETAAAIARARRAPIVVETSTLPIAAKESARDALAARRAVLLDCPLSGTAAQARAKDLVVYASGPRDAYDRVAPVLDGFSRAHYHVGPFGNGSKMKFVANLLVAIHNVAAAEAFVLAMRAGLDPAVVLDVIGNGAGSSRMFQVRGPMMVAGRYDDATMKIDVWQKDMTVIGDFARAVASPTPLFSASAPLYTAAMAMGRGKEDTAAVCAVLEAMAGQVRTPRPAGPAAYSVDKTARARRRPSRSQHKGAR